jgi:glycosyltransferase involved in cell wall biosynthesis
VKPIRILVDSLADAGLPNAQMGNAREIVCRLDPKRFHVSMFVLGKPDPRIVVRDNTRLIQLPERRQTLRILREFLWGSHRVVFYLKPAPASRWYLALRRQWDDRRIVVGTIEATIDFRKEPTVLPEYIRQWEQTILRSDCLFSNSACVQKSLAREYHMKSAIIPTGVDTNFFFPDFNRPPNSRSRVLFVGSLKTYKQPQLLVDAAQRFPQADFRIAGAGPLAIELRRRVAEHALPNVHLLGPLSAEELRREYQSADIFLFPSRWEGSPKVILEAAACGLPVIIRNDYSAETVVHGVTGYQAGTDEEILQYLILLLSDPRLREELGRRGREHSKKYDWDKITNRWEEAFVNLAAGALARKAS